MPPQVGFHPHFPEGVGKRENDKASRGEADFFLAVGASWIAFAWDASDWNF